MTQEIKKLMKTSDVEWAPCSHELGKDTIGGRPASYYRNPDYLPMLPKLSQFTKG